jgi:hypothetical protein
MHEFRDVDTVLPHFVQDRVRETPEDHTAELVHPVPDAGVAPDPADYTPDLGRKSPGARRAIFTLRGLREAKLLLGDFGELDLQEAIRSSMSSTSSAGTVVARPDLMSAIVRRAPLKNRRVDVIHGIKAVLRLLDQRGALSGRKIQHGGGKLFDAHLVLSFS